MEVHWGSVGGRVRWGSVGGVFVGLSKVRLVCRESKVFHKFIHPMIEFLTTLCRHSRRVFKPFRIPAVAVGMHQGTDDGRVKVIIFGSYLGVVCFRPEYQSLL